MGSNETATATTGGPRVIAYLTGTVRHRVQIILGNARAALRAREAPPPSSSARDPSAADDDATPVAPAAFADSGPDGSSGEALASARDAEAFLK